MDIQWSNFLNTFNPVVWLYVIQVLVLFRLWYKSIFGYLVSLLIMVLIPLILLWGLLFFVGDNRGGHGFYPP